MANGNIDFSRLTVLIVTTDARDFEYRCNSCGQLRLCCKHPFIGCGNCGSNDIVKGPIGSLPKSS